MTGVSQKVSASGTADRPRVRNPYSRLPNWLYPAFVVVALSLFGVFAVWVVFFQHDGLLRARTSAPSTRR